MTLSRDNSCRKMNIGNFITTSSERFSKLDGGNAILFQIKGFGRKLEETTLERFFIKKTAQD